jgi:hypothetical protein
MKPRYLTLPSMEEPGSVLNLIQQTVEKTRELVKYPCISMLRLLFGSVESTLEEQQKRVPSEFDATAFESLRWRYHALPHNMSLHGNPKVIIDVSGMFQYIQIRDPFHWLLFLKARQCSIGLTKHFLVYILCFSHSRRILPQRSRLQHSSTCERILSKEQGAVL